ncbi:nucleoside transporter C-terminal domain-containing protein [uncultured Thiohalocapsa sp.]|uniref:NupC/NupG family nucleoside CNT transporter n=1 Tax=uncultured Thiohalocapsa sp. TaxID=768990 RepID=UPI0025F38D68|nr:nucleoside transporter C-terminal domain-containing protein [uncultured Thiohalocapsa sp.]
MTELLLQAARGALGIGVLLAIAWVLSETRGAVRVRLVLGGLALQLALAVLLLKLPAAQQVFVAVNGLVLALNQATEAGTSFVFGHVGGGAAPYEVAYPDNSFVLAFRALPLVLVIGSLSALLFHWRVLPVLVRGFAWLLRRLLGVGGPLGLGAAANVFIGMVEAPLLIKPYLAGLSRSALFALMTTGMATIAGTVMVLYATLIGAAVPNALGHILTASLVNAPGALVIAGILVPAPTSGGPDAAEDVPPVRQEYAGAMDAITRGALDALPLLLNIIAMLIVMVALVSLGNAALALLPAVGNAPLTLQRLLGWVFAPVVWLVGIPWQEATAAGQLMGIKTVLNELLAYIELAGLPAQDLSERSRLIMTYALCGFANFGSLGIMLGGLGALAPSRRTEVAALGLRAILAGTLTTLMTAALVGILL